MYKSLMWNVFKDSLHPAPIMTIFAATTIYDYNPITIAHHLSSHKLIYVEYYFYKGIQ